MGLGPFPRVSLATARNAAHAARVLLDQGVNPLTRRLSESVGDQQKTKQVTFKEFALQFVNLKRAEWRNEKHAEQWIYTLTEYAFPFIGDKPINIIETDDVLSVVLPIWTTKTETASRLRGRIERILSAATVKKLRTGPNPAIWRGHLDALLPQPKKIARVVHHPALPYSELPAFMEKLQGREGVASLALEFTILTAARTGEVLGGKKVEIYGDVWCVPGERMKAGRPHRVPLGTRALEIIAQASLLDRDSPYLFSRNGKPLSSMAMLTLLDRMKYSVTVHGFRSTFRDWVSELTRYSPEVAEMALAHTIGNKAEAAYRRGDLLEVRRALMQDWAAYCMCNNVEVLPLKVA